MNDDRIIAILKSGRRNKALVRLYRYYPKVEKLVCSRGGNKADAQDIFQESLIIFCERIQNESFKLTSAIDTYLYGVCRFLWSNELKKRNRRTGLAIPIEEQPAEEVEVDQEREEKIQKAMSALAQIGARCLELLKLFYYQSLKMEEIAEAMGLSSAKVARNQKYKCLERAKLKLKEEQH